MACARFFVISLLLLGLLTACAAASVPAVISYQGRLTQPSGAPVADGTYSMLFSIYDVPTGGSALWSETNAAVQVKGGLFATMLGSVVNLPANIFDSPTRYFAVKVGSDPEMTPRQQIASVGYSFRAATVDDGAITADKLAIGVGTPAGAIMQFGGSSAPAGWLLCDGSAISRTGVNAALFAAIGAAYGAGDGSTTFNLPDMRGRVPVGVDGGAGRVTSNNALGQSSGEQSHALSLAELPAHTHGPGNLSTDGAHWDTDDSVYTIGGSTQFKYMPWNGAFVGGDPAKRNDIKHHHDVTSGVTGSAGSGSPANVMQPYQVVNYIIKY